MSTLPLVEGFSQKESALGDRGNSLPKTGSSATRVGPKEMGCKLIAQRSGERCSPTVFKSRKLTLRDRIVGG